MGGVSNKLNKNDKFCFGSKQMLTSLNYTSDMIKFNYTFDKTKVTTTCLWL